MARKDVQIYYDQVCEQYHEMLENIKDFEKECSDGLIEPERLDQLKLNMQPIINNYKTLSWIMFLLNKPTKKSKHVRYENQNKKFIKHIEKQFTQQGIINSNEKTLQQLKNIINKGDK